MSPLFSDYASVQCPFLVPPSITSTVHQECCSSLLSFSNYHTPLVLIFIGQKVKPGLADACSSASAGVFNMHITTDPWSSFEHTSTCFRHLQRHLTDPYIVRRGQISDSNNNITEELGRQILIMLCKICCFVKIIEHLCLILIMYTSIHEYVLGPLGPKHLVHPEILPNKIWVATYAYTVGTTCELMGYIVLMVHPSNILYTVCS
jgi:hypothetical protein